MAGNRRELRRDGLHGQAVLVLDRNATLVLDYAVEPGSAPPGAPKTWWQQQYGSKPDLTLNLPRLLDYEEQAGISSDAARFISPGVIRACRGAARVAVAARRGLRRRRASRSASAPGSRTTASRTSRGDTRGRVLRRRSRCRRRADRRGRCPRRARPRRGRGEARLDPDARYAGSAPADLRQGRCGRRGRPRSTRTTTRASAATGRYRFRRSRPALPRTFSPRSDPERTRRRVERSPSPDSAFGPPVARRRVSGGRCSADRADRFRRHRRIHRRGSSGSVPGRRVLDRGRHLFAGVASGRAGRRRRRHPRRPRQRPGGRRGCIRSARLGSPGIHRGRADHELPDPRVPRSGADLRRASDRHDGDRGRDRADALGPDERPLLSVHGSGRQRSWPG